MRKPCGVVAVAWILLAPSSNSFLSPTPPRRRHQATQQSLYSTIEREGPHVPIHDIPSQFHPLFLAAANATVLKGANSGDGAHDSFRYEWGTWCVDENVEYLMDRVNEVRLNQGV